MTIHERKEELFRSMDDLHKAADKNSPAGIQISVELVKSQCDYLIFELGRCHKDATGRVC